MSLLTQANARAATLRQSESAYDPLRDVGNVTESFGRGVEAGSLGIGASLRSAVGGVAEAFDFDQFAAQQYKAANDLKQQAAAVGPRISSLDQLDKQGYSLRNMGDFAMGVMGGALPSTAVGLGASVLSGGAPVPSLLAGTAAYTPMAVGETVEKFREANPGQKIDGETMARLGVTGLGSAAFESIVPAMVGGKIAGKGLASAPAATVKQAVGRNLAEIPMEGFTEGAGEYIRQAGATPDAPTDWKQIKEGVVAGMIGGVPAAGVGAAADYARGNAQKVGDLASSASKFLTSNADSAKTAMEGPAQAVAGASKDAWGHLKDLGESAWKGFAESDLGQAGAERVANMRQRAAEILSDPDVPGEWKSKVEQAAKGMGNAVNAGWVAAVDNARMAAKKVKEDGIIKSAADAYRSVADKVANGEYLGDLADMTGPDSAVRTKLDASAKKASEAAKAFGDDLLRRAGVDEETKAEIKQAMSDLGQEANQRVVAAKWRMHDLKDSLVGKFNDLSARFKKGYNDVKRADVDVEARWVNDEQKALPGPKKSEDYSGVREIIGQALRPHMAKINEAVGKDPKALATVAEGLRNYIEAITDSKGRTDEVDRGFARMTLVDALGDNATEIMADIAEKIGVGQSREQADAVFTELSDLQSLQRSHADLRKLMTKGMPKEQHQEVDKDLYRVMEWALGQGVTGDKKDVSQAEIRFRNQKMESDLQTKYGPAKAKAILAKVEQMLSPKSKTEFNPEAERLAAEQDGIDYETALREDQLQEESRFIGSSSNRKGLFVDPKIHAKNYPEEAAQGKGTGNELMKDVVEKEFPNANVRFVSVAEDPSIYDRSPTEKSKLTKRRKELETELPGDKNAAAREQALAEFRAERIKQLSDEGRGMFRVDHSSHDRLSVEEIDAMRMDTENYGDPNHPSRLEIKPEGAGRAAHVFDAKRVTRAAMARINRERTWTKGDDVNALTRMARAFSDGVAALMQEYGRFKVRGDLVIGTINDKPVTAAEALKYDKRTAKDRKVDDQTMEAVEIRKRGKELREQMGQTTNKETLRELQEEYKALKFRLKTLNMSREGRVNTDLAAKTTEDMEALVRSIDKKLSEERDVSKRQALEKERDYLTSRLDDAYEREFADKQHQDGARQDADPDGNIHQAGARLSAKDLEARTNMDGSTKALPSKYVANAKPLIVVAEKVREAGGIGETLANRLTTLALNFPMISEKDQRTLLALRGATKPSDVGPVVNAMARKYAGAIVPPKVRPPAETKRTKPVEKSTEGTPDPKAVAAKKAAFLERAASGDKALIKELQESTDLKGLQRAVDALNKADTAPEVATIINDRIRELVKDENQAYHAQTRKYSLSGVDSEAVALEQFETLLWGEMEDRIANERDPAEAARLQGMMDKAFNATTHELTGEKFVGEFDVQYAKQIADELGLKSKYWGDQIGDTRFSNERTDPNSTKPDGPSEPLNAKAIREHIHKVLGDTVQIEFANIMYAGDFTRQNGEDIIRISVHALNPMSTAYHESLHAFFAQLRDKGLPDVVGAVYKGLNSPHVMKQLRERLKDSPEALAQLSDPEERAAYAYQFWASDPTFSLKPETRTVFEKIAAAIRKVLGIWSNDERALEIFKYFHSGQYQKHSASKLAIHTATMRAGRNGTVDTLTNLVQPITDIGDALLGAGGERMRDTGVPSLIKMAELIKRKGTQTGRDGGYIPAARLARTEHMNWLANALKDYNQADLNEALEAMQEGVKAKSTSARIIQKIVQEKFLRERMFDGYLTPAGVKLGDLGKDYFPRVWDPITISKNQEAFIEMLESYGVKNADVILDKIVSGAGTEWGFDNAQIVIERPGFVNARERKLAFISGKDASPFLQKDFWKTMDSYTTQATRRGEWSRRFGYKNERFDALLAEAEQQGATSKQIELAKNYAKAVDGTLGDDINPNWRVLQGNMIVYQNIRLLPLAIFSSVVDPLGIIVRGGTVRDAWATFKRGVAEMRKSWQKDPTFDGDTAMAEQLGTIENAMLQHTISSAYGQGMMGDKAQKINDLFFRYNFMEGWNRSVRVGATQAAIGFIKRHVQKPNEHSKRYLAELGLKADEVKFDAEGQLVFDERTKKAINRWVDGAVLRPDAADTAIWMHDPHYAIFAHLKQFAFAFHHTFLKRVWHEYQHGNYKPLMALGSFVPVMMAADLLKDMLANGGDEPEWKKNWTFMDHVGYGIERAGLLGVSQFALDGLGDIRNGGTGVGALSGPTMDQLLDGVQVLGGRREFSSFALRSMPANSLYRGYMSTADEMEFEGESAM